LEWSSLVKNNIPDRGQEKGIEEGTEESGRPGGCVKRWKKIKKFILKMMLRKCAFSTAGFLSRRQHA